MWIATEEEAHAAETEGEEGAGDTRNDHFKAVLPLVLEFVAKFGGPRSASEGRPGGESVASCCQCAVQLAVMIQDEFAKGDVVMAAGSSDAVFDYVKQGITVEEDGKQVKSTSSGQWAVLDQGFTSGKGAWEFKLIHDNMNDECSCFGAAIKPIHNDSYEYSNELWMLRGYNGSLYHGRSIGKSVGKARSPTHCLHGMN